MKRFLASLIVVMLAFPLDARDWAEICRSGNLRVLTIDGVRGSGSESASSLHRVMMPIDRERILLKRFADAHNLRIVHVPGENFQSLFTMLKEGRGDLISANVAETARRKKEYLLSIPFCYTKEFVFTAEKSPVAGNDASALANHQGWLLPGTTYVESLQAYAAADPRIRFRSLPKTISHDELIERVLSGQIAYSVLNESDLDAWMSYRSGIRKLFAVDHRVPLVFAAAANSPELVRQLNAFIRQSQTPEAAPVAVRKKAPAAVPAVPAEKIVDPAAGETADLEAIRRRGYIRMITSNDVFTCYLKRGTLCGFEYELASRFAKSLNVSLVTVIPANFNDMMQYLQEGKGDFIAANLTLTPERQAKYPNLTFCAPYHGAREMLVGRKREKISSVAALTGRKIYVRKGSSYYQTLRKLHKNGGRFQIITVPESEHTPFILRKVSAGKYDLTVADETFLALTSERRSLLKPLMALTEKRPFVWTVRKNNPQLAAAVNEFFRKENKGVFFNLCVKRYYDVKHAHQYVPLMKKAEKKLTISPYDDLFRKYGALYEIKWYLLAAQAFQESRFRPELVNEIGATGLMQVMPATAKEMGICNLTVPENGIHAGAKYMAKLGKRFPASMTPQNRLCFMLAAYNAGYGHVWDARKLAAKKGLNPNVWFNHVEKALALLEEPEYASKARFGYCRASETIPYVRNIMVHTQGYITLVQAHQQKKKINQK